MSNFRLVQEQNPPVQNDYSTGGGGISACDSNS